MQGCLHSSYDCVPSWYSFVQVLRFGGFLVFIRMSEEKTLTSFRVFCWYLPDLFSFLRLILCVRRQCYHCHYDFRALPEQGVRYYIFHLFLYGVVLASHAPRTIEKRSGHKARSLICISWEMTILVAYFGANGRTWTADLRVMSPVL